MQQAAQATQRAPAGRQPLPSLPLRPQTHPQPAAQSVPEGLCGHGLVQLLPHEGLQVPKDCGCVHQQLPGGVML